MTNIVPIDTIKKMKIGLSTSVLFDMSESDAIWRAEQNGDVPKGSYHRYMIDNINTPLKPRADMYDIVCDHVETGHYELIIMSRNSALTGMRAIKTLVQKGLVPDQFVFTNGADIAQYCLLYGVDQFFTANESDAQAVNLLGIPAALYDHTIDLKTIDVQKLLPQTEPEKLFTRPHIPQNTALNNPQPKTDFNRSAQVLDYVFDFDKVLAGPESDDFFAKSGFDLTQYRQHEFDKLHIEMQKAAWFVRYETMMTQSRAVHRAHINTARGAEASLRMFITLAKWGVEPNGEIHCMNGADKTPILKELKNRYGNILFLDDGQKNVDRARKAGISTGLVPSGNPDAYLKG